MKLLTKEEHEPYENAKTLVNKSLKMNIWKIKNFVKLEVIVITQNNIEMLHIPYVI